MAQKKEKQTKSESNPTNEKHDIAKKAMQLENKIKKLKLELEKKAPKEEK